MLRADNSAEEGVTPFYCVLVGAFGGGTASDESTSRS
jgi:hypothetical protein